MKCPQCGNEVVIATDLCPWCGYRHDFDGSIERSGPVYEDVAEDTRRDRRRKVKEPRERAAGGAVRTELGMRWYRFVVSLILPLTGVAYIASALSALGGLYTDIVYYGGILVFAPHVLVIRFAMVVIYIVFGVLAFAAARSLQRRAKSGISVYMSVILVPAVAELGFGIMTYYMYLITLDNFVSVIERFAVAVVYAALMAVYFRRRAELFD